jgi:hypothetical protein
MYGIERKREGDEEVVHNLYMCVCQRALDENVDFRCNFLRSSSIKRDDFSSFFPSRRLIRFRLSYSEINSEIALQTKLECVSTIFAIRIARYIHRAYIQYGTELKRRMVLT